jgi:hypothetical protein
MGFLKTIYNVEEQTWNIDSSEVAHDHNEVQISTYTPENKEQDISHLEFEFCLKKDGNEILTGKCPVDPIRYELSKTALLHYESTELLPNEEYTIESYCRNIHTKELVASKSISFITPKPPKKFESWHWNNSTKLWEAPIPYPDPVNGIDDPIPHKLYQWSEKRQNWIEGTPEEVQD